MPIRISPKMKEEVRKSLEDYNTLLSRAQKDSSVDLGEVVARVKFDSFEELKKEPEYSDIEVLTGERDAYQNIMLMCETTDYAPTKPYSKLSLAKYVEFVVELRLYKNVARRKNIRDIQTAREFGDLSENAEYTIAREQQGKIESHILELDYIANNCEIIEPKDSYTEGDIGSTVTIVNQKTKQSRTFMLTGCFEADINSVPQKISNESPIGKAVMGKKVGDNVMVVTNRGKDIYKITAIK